MGQVASFLANGFIDYAIYIAFDLLARRSLVQARSQGERFALLRKMSLVVLLISLPIARFHHTPYVLWTLTFLTYAFTVVNEHTYNSALHKLSESRRRLARLWNRWSPFGAGEPSGSKSVGRSVSVGDRTEFRKSDCDGGLRGFSGGTGVAGRLRSSAVNAVRPSPSPESFVSEKLPFEGRVSSDRLVRRPLHSSSPNSGSASSVSRSRFNGSLSPEVTGGYLSGMAASSPHSVHNQFFTSTPVDRSDTRAYTSTNSKSMYRVSHGF